jgi:hypothetical protein
LLLGKAMDNRRKAERLPSFLGGTIIYNRGRFSLPCIVKNLSPTGAKLTAKNLPTLPERFDLHVPQKKATYAVRMTWREGDVVGVAIEGTSGDEAQARKSGRDAKTDEPSDMGI